MFVKMLNILLKPLRESEGYCDLFFKIVSDYIYPSNAVNNIRMSNLLLIFVTVIKIILMSFISFQMLNLHVFQLKLLILDFILILIILIIFFTLDELKRYCDYSLGHHIDKYKIYMKTGYNENNEVILKEMPIDIDPLIVFYNKRNYVLYLKEEIDPQSQYDCKFYYLYFGQTCQNLNLILLDFNKTNKAVDLILLLCLIGVILYIVIT